MERRDEELRDTLIDRMTQAKIDSRNLEVEVDSGGISVTGAVPSEEERQRLRALFSDVVNLECRVEIVPVAASDTLDGRGRSPITGTSADSQHESRHQTDKS
jgi:hypothetical protein